MRLGPLWMAVQTMLTGALASGLVAQEEGGPLVVAHEYVVPSLVLGEDRPIAVGLPAPYDSTAAYPVIYVLDGPDHMLHTLASARFLARNDRMPPAIVVTIGNTEGNRTRDLTPLPGEEAQRSLYPMAGGVDDFQAFLRDELQPWVESRYRTRPYSILIGHSFGGLLISNVLNTEPDLFDAYIAISPSLWWDEERFVESMGDMFNRFPEARGALYMTMGNEGGSMLAGAWRLAGTLEKHAPDGFRWHWQPMPGETHGSVPARSTYDGLEWVFSAWYPADLLAALADRGASELPQIQRHYEELSAEMGWEVEPPFYHLVETIWRLGQDGRSDDAMKVAQALSTSYPQSHLIRVGMGEAYRSQCRLQEARDAISEAMEMAEEQGEATDLHKARLQEVEAMIEGDEPCTPSG